MKGSIPSPAQASLDERLTRAFAGLDVSPDFEVRLAARISREPEQDVSERLHRARQLEQERYRALRHSRGWRHDARSLLSLVTLETAGILALVVLAASMGWAPLTAWLDAQTGIDIVSVLRENALFVWPSAVGILVGLVPLIAQRARFQGWRYLW